jgi:hypothetical protein
MITCILAVLLPKLQNIPWVRDTGYEVKVKQLHARDRGSPSRRATFKIAGGGAMALLAGALIGSP